MATATPGRIFAADVDGDGRQDLVILAGGSLISYLLGPAGGPKRVDSARGDSTLIDVAVADFDGDGLPDIVTLVSARSADGAVRQRIEIFSGVGDGTYLPALALPLAGSYSWLAVGDFNGDGKPDLAVGDLSTDLTVFLNACREGRLVGTLPTVVSAPGAFGSYFRTRLSLKNPSNETIQGKFVFHADWRLGRDDDADATFALAPAETQTIEDVLGRVGWLGRGSLDIRVTAGAAPLAYAEIRNVNDVLGGPSGIENSVPPARALTAGEQTIFTIPFELSSHRMALGGRTFAEDVSLQVAAVDRTGHVVASTLRRFGPYRSFQIPAPDFVNGSLPEGGSVRCTVISGSILMFATTADNATSVPVIQVSSP